MADEFTKAALYWIKTFNKKVKEKIWMQKLIGLLNEYVEETDFWDNLNEYNEVEILDEETLEVNWKYHDIEYLYTKKFWFIKWLVENDKVDLENEELISLMSELWERGNPVKCLLMLLSIQDEPIRFLCEILK